MLDQIIAFIIAWSYLFFVFAVCLGLATIVAWFFPEDMQGTVSAGCTIGFLVIYAYKDDFLKWMNGKDKEDK